MNVITKKENDKLTLTVEGSVDSQTAPELEAVVNSEIRDCKELIFDFKNLNYISSAGLRILLGTHKLMLKQGRMAVINVNEAVNEIFEITGFSFILEIDTI